jgi:hypothetical protein
VLPRRLGARFALEALFLVLLAVGAGLADLRPLFIVLVMAVAWLLVALAELTAERIDRSPLSYLLPAPSEPEDELEDEPERVFGPRPEERTVVAPLESLDARAVEAGRPAPEPEAAEPEHEPEPEPVPEPEPESPPLPATAGLEAALEPSEGGRLRSFLRRREPELKTETPEPEPAAPEPPPVPATVAVEAPLEPSQGRLRSLLRRREPEPEEAPPDQPRHVKLLPRREAPEPSRAAQEVAELFGTPAHEEPDEPRQPEETGT